MSILTKAYDAAADVVGVGVANGKLVAFGGKRSRPESVPEDRQAACAAALQSLAGSDTSKPTELDAEKIFARWNNPPKRDA